MVPQKILVPYNFTAMDRKAVDFVVRVFGADTEAQVTLFNTYTSLPEVETDSSTVMGRLKTGVQFLADEVRKRESELLAAGQTLRDGGFTESRLSHVFRPRSKDIADEIVEEAKSGEYTVLVLTCRPERVTRFFARSVHEKVITNLKGVTICVVT